MNCRLEASRGENEGEAWLGSWSRPGVRNGWCAAIRILKVGRRKVGTDRRRTIAPHPFTLLAILSQLLEQFRFQEDQGASGGSRLAPGRRSLEFCRESKMQFEANRKWSVIDPAQGPSGCRASPPTENRLFDGGSTPTVCEFQQDANDT